MRIRMLCREDYPDVDALVNCLHKIHVNGRPDLFHDVPHIVSKESYEKMLADTDYICIGAEKDGRIIGICIACLLIRICMVDICSARIDHLYVDEKYRHQGVATELFQNMASLAKDRGAVRLDLTVWDFNKDAMDFYRAMGMKTQKYEMELSLEELIESKELKYLKD